MRNNLPCGKCVADRDFVARGKIRPRMLEIIWSAGLKEWPKLFQNMRSTRQTELEETFPRHVVCAWIGNSEPVAAKHYLQVTDEHFEQAVQNPVQHPAAASRNEQQAGWVDAVSPDECEAMRRGAALYESAETSRLGDTGLEPVTSRV